MKGTPIEKSVLTVRINKERGLNPNRVKKRNLIAEYRSTTHGAEAKTGRDDGERIWNGHGIVNRRVDSVTIARLADGSVDYS